MTAVRHRHREHPVSAHATHHAQSEVCFLTCKREVGKCSRLEAASTHSQTPVRPHYSCGKSFMAKRCGQEKLTGQGFLASVPQGPSPTGGSTRFFRLPQAWRGLCRPASTQDGEQGTIFVFVVTPSTPLLLTCSCLVAPCHASVRVCSRFRHVGRWTPVSTPEARMETSQT